MTLLANIFSFSTIFSRMFSRTHKLRYLRAISKKRKNLKTIAVSRFFWSCWADSNCRPHPYQGCALPTELQQQMATRKGFEPSTSGVTGRRSNQLNYLAIYWGILIKEQFYYNIYKRTCKVFFYGRGRKTRTLDTRFWRPLLYQLSYTPIWWAFGDSNPGPTGYEPAALTNWAKGPNDCLSLIFEKERVPPPEWRHSWLPLLDSNQRHRG